MRKKREGKEEILPFLTTTNQGTMSKTKLKWEMGKKITFNRSSEFYSIENWHFKYQK